MGGGDQQAQPAQGVMTIPAAGIAAGNRINGAPLQLAG